MADALADQSRRGAVSPVPSDDGWRSVVAGIGSLQTRGGSFPRAFMIRHSEKGAAERKAEAPNQAMQVTATARRPE
jgi:hypothetical protein